MVGRFGSAWKASRHGRGTGPSCLISVMRHDEQLGEGDIPAHHPLGILEEGRINSFADGLRRPLIGLDKGAAMHLIMGQRVDPLLQLVDDLADCRCLVRSGHRAWCQSSLTPFRYEKIAPCQAKGGDLPSIRSQWDGVSVTRGLPTIAATGCECWPGRSAWCGTALRSDHSGTSRRHGTSCVRTRRGRRIRTTIRKLLSGTWRASIE